MHDEETNTRIDELVRQIQEKSLQLSDLEIILEDYAHERSELLREIGRLKAALWELTGESPVKHRSTSSDHTVVTEPRS